MPGPPKEPPQVSFRVENFDAAYNALRLREVSNLSDPLSPCPGIRVAHFSDPDGHLIGIEGPRTNAKRQDDSAGLELGAWCLVLT